MRYKLLLILALLVLVPHAWAQTACIVTAAGVTGAPCVYTSPTAVGPSASGVLVTFVAANPGTCTPGTTGPVELNVAPYTISYCSATNTWTALGAGGSGTVTVVGSGSLTSTALVTGGGTTTLQTPAATATMDSSGNISTPGTVTSAGGVTNGTGAGFYAYGQGADNCVSKQGANSDCEEANPTIATAFHRVRTGSPATGIEHYSYSSPTLTESISPIVSADLNITTSTCTNQFVTAISAAAAGTCTSATLASAQFANQGTTTTVLHGNAAGNPAFGAVVGADMTNNTVTATQLAAQYSKGSCTEVWGGSGTSFAMTAGDDAISNNSCYNDSGVTRTITAVKCRADNASNTTVLTPTFGSAGTGTAILTGTVTCGNSYAYSATGTLNNTAWTTGTGIDPGMSTVGNATSVAMIVEYTY